MRFSMYALGSTATCCWLALQAYQQRRQFYPTVIHLTSSKVSLLALSNEALVLTLLFGQLCKCIFFGRLREAEVEHLYERSWYAITETCLAMTIFREEFNFRFVTLFTALLFLKIFHWLMQDRISYMEQTPAVPLMTHARMLLLMAILFALDSAFLYHAVSISIQQKAPSVLLLFAFEHLILASTVCSTFSKYALHINDLRLAGRWDSKGVCMFYLELMTDLFQMLVYLAFFFLICTFYGLPLHIMRDLYLTVRSFRSRVTDFIRYRRITHNMQERFPDASEEDLEHFDRTCIICREHLGTAKKLACGHMFHFHCLRSWLERQQTCPTCRAPIAPAEPPAPAPADANGADAAGVQPAAGIAEPMLPVAEPWNNPADPQSGFRALPPQWQGVADGDATGANVAAFPGATTTSFGVPSAGHCPMPGGWTNAASPAGFPGSGIPGMPNFSTPTSYPYMCNPGMPPTAIPGAPTMCMPPMGMHPMGMHPMGMHPMGMHPMGMPGLAVTPPNQSGNPYAPMFAPAVILPPHIQPAMGESFVTTFMQQQIDWLQQQLDSIQAAQRCAPSAVSTAAGAQFSASVAAPCAAPCAECSTCSNDNGASSPPAAGAGASSSFATTSTQAETVKQEEVPSFLKGLEGDANTPSPDDKDELRRRRVDRLASSSSVD